MEKVGRNAVPERHQLRKLTERATALIPRLQAGARVLEVGCAEGDLGQHLKSIVPLTYWGIEPSRDAEIARTLLDVVLPDARAILGNTHSFDCIISFHVLEHIADIAGELAHWHSLIHPNGWLMIEVPCRSGHLDLDTDRNAEHLHHFSPASISILLERSGFDILNLSRGHFESPVYNDSLRILASLKSTIESTRARQLRRFSAMPTPFAVFGLGGDFRNYVLPIIDQLPVVALIDTNPSSILGFPTDIAIETYDYIRHGHLPILVCSLRHEASILADLGRFGHPTELIHLLADIYQEPFNA